MSASNLSVADRDSEALRRAQQAHESSMDDILASLRDIIADDNQTPAETARTPKVETAGGPQIVYRNDAKMRGAAAAPTRPQEPWPGELASVRNGSERPREAANSSIGSAAEASSAREGEPPLASPATEEVVAACFNALSTSVALQSSGRIEGLMREMLRPMLKSWINDNLAGLVERLVRTEIERVARGRR